MWECVVEFSRCLLCSNVCFVIFLIYVFSDFDKDMNGTKDFWEKNKQRLFFFDLVIAWLLRKLGEKFWFSYNSKTVG